MKVHFSKTSQIDFENSAMLGMLYLYASKEEKNKIVYFMILLQYSSRLLNFLQFRCEGNMNKCLHSASSFREPLVNFEEISCG